MNKKRQNRVKLVVLIVLGMLAATSLGIQLGIKGCSAEIFERLKRLLSRVGLPVSAELAPTEELLASMKRDKKVQDESLRLVLPSGLGSVVIVDDAELGAVAEAWKVIRKSS